MRSVPGTPLARYANALAQFAPSFCAAEEFAGNDDEPWIRAVHGARNYTEVVRSGVAETRWVRLAARVVALPRGSIEYKNLSKKHSTPYEQLHALR